MNTSAIDPEKLLSSREAAEFLGVPTNSISYVSKRMRDFSSDPKYGKPLPFYEGIAGRQYHRRDLIVFREQMRKEPKTF